ncbi:Reverse transcriptase [Nocardioides solisilvae]|uniref:Reverse transcriptase n=1 Tax=Nocardioides solisilvae TaxID=1542435 RepID=UPI0013A593E4|nr:Reverse transcriptase [Nocardioides solisilvae]
MESGATLAEVTLEDLVVSYRKAKVDCFLATDQRALELAAYEDDLERNLRRLLRLIQSSDEHWVETSNFVGGFTVRPKSIGLQDRPASSYWSDPTEDWQYRAERAQERPRARFRLMAACSIDFHVFSTLWMLKVGTLLDGRLTEDAYGSRLRRGHSGGPNLLGHGSFKHYYTPYQEWRDAGLEEMTRALDAGESVVALTADATSFYHALDPAFLLDRRFLDEVLGVRLNSDQRRLNRLFVRGLQAWARQLGSMGWSPIGLPVGLPASAVVANVALAEFDEIVQRLEPRYYGRYVDDIILVMDDDGRLQDHDAIWDRVLRLSGSHIRRVREPGAGGAVAFSPPYFNGVEVRFENEKNKSFHLTDRSGRALIDSIKAEIAERSSEWRTLPTVPGDSAAISAKVARAARRDGSNAATLKDADRVSARRLSFSLALRDFEAYERNLDHDAWAARRIEFFDAALEHVLSLPALFDLVPELPRLVQLAAACGDADSLERLVSTLMRLPDEVERTCDVQLAYYSVEESQPEIAALWAESLLRSIVEWLTVAWNDSLTASDTERILRPLGALAREYRVSLPGVSALRRDHRRLGSRDLARQPYRWAALNLPRPPGRDEVPEPLSIAGLPLPRAVVEGLDALGDAMDEEHAAKAFRGMAGGDVAGLAFSTRPPTVLEVYMVVHGRGSRLGVPPRRLINSILRAVRGYPPLSDLPRFRRASDSDAAAVVVPLSTTGSTRRIAVSMFATNEKHAKAAASGNPHLSVARFDQVSRVLDSLLRQPGRAHYLLLPELALPPHLFTHFAHQLRIRRGPNLVSGVEHQPSGPSTVANQVWAALEMNGLGFPTYFYRQDKQRPANFEARLLHGVGKSLSPLNTWDVPPVIVHGEFQFGLLVCSELTNIAHRAHLRGQVDVLFVPEWNPDLETFAALVESAALDMHSFIAQANDRGHGDSRIRAPMKDSWLRDVVRLRGGDRDYIVVGEIDFHELRAFHATRFDPSCCSPAKPLFKPLPDGFKAASSRDAVPLGTCNCVADKCTPDCACSEGAQGK